MVHSYEAFFGIVMPFMAEFKLIGLAVELMLIFHGSPFMVHLYELYFI